MEVEDVGNATGDTVSQFTRHAVFGNLREKFVRPGVQFARDVAAERFRERGETGGFSQFASVFREVNTQRGEIVSLAGHGIAEDHGGAIRVQRPLGIAVVFQRFAGAGDGPFLRPIHGIDHAGRDGQPPLHRVPHEVANPAADF